MNTTTKNTLTWAIISGLFAIPFVPFIVTWHSMLFPFITGKGFTFRLITEIIFALWVLLAIADPIYRPKWNAITQSVVVFLGIVFLADLFSIYPYKSFWSNYERMEGFVTIIHLVAFYFVSASVLKTKTWWKWFWNTNLFASFLMSIYGMFQLAGQITIDQGGGRLDGTFGNSSYLAIYMVFCVFIALTLLVKEDRKVWKWIYGALAVIDAGVVYYTATRGSILGLIAGIVLTSLIVAWKERHNKTMRKIAVGLVVGVAVLVGVFISVRNTDYVKKNLVLSRFASLSVSDIKTQGRYYVWPMALKGIAERPILGWGQESFNYVFNQNYNPAMYAQEQWFDRTHNIVLDWLINAGVLGLLSYVSLYVTLMYLLWKKTDFSVEEKSLVTGLMVAYVFHNMFVFDNLMSYILFFAILAWVSSLSSHAASHEKPVVVSSETMQYLYMPAVAVALCLCVYFVNIPAISASTTLIDSITQQPEVKTNLAYFTQVFAYNSFGSPEALEQLTKIALDIITSQSPSITQANKQDFFNLADTQIKAQIARTPQDARYLFLAGSFYNRVGQYDVAMKYLTDAVKYSPTKSAMYFELGSSYLGKGDVEKAFALFTQGYNLEKDSPDAQIIYALGALYAHKQDVLNQMFAMIGQDRLVADDRVLQAYVNLKDYKSAETILIIRLAKDPTNYNNQLQLASVYAMAGNKAKAIELIKDVEAKNPSSKAQLDPYIDQLSK